MNSEFRDARDEDTLKKAVRHFDLSKGGSGNSKPNDRPGTPELASILKDLISGIRKEGEATRAAIVAAYKPFNEEMNRYPRSMDNQQSRSDSPRRFIQREMVRGRSPDYRRPRSPSPSTYSRRDQPPRRNDHEPTAPIAREDRQISRPISGEAFSSEAYYERFGKPPTPCGICQQMHWSRHCLEHLKE